MIALGVKDGIERSNKVLMPLLFAMAIGIAAWVCCQPGSGEGLKYYLVPNLDSLRVAGADGVARFSVAQLGKTVLGAMGQMFYSLSLSMGIMITYGSYMRKEDSIEKCVRRIEVFDTLIAVVAGLMIIPVVYMFAVKTGTPVKEAMNAGPGLMFVTLPKVFAGFGGAGPWVGATFFLLVIFAALTSAISLYEACVAAVCDLLKMGRLPATFFTFFLISFLAVFSAIGYGPWSDVTLSTGLHNLGLAGAWTDGAFFKMQALDFFDFVTNSFLMPVVAAMTCVFIGWVVKTKCIEEEVLHGESRFAAQGFYRKLWGTHIHKPNVLLQIHFCMFHLLFVTYVSQHLTIHREDPRFPYESYKNTFTVNHRQCPGSCLAKHLYYHFHFVNSRESCCGLNHQLAHSQLLVQFSPEHYVANVVDVQNCHQLALVVQYGEHVVLGNRYLLHHFVQCHLGL